MWDSLSIHLDSTDFKMRKRARVGMLLVLCGTLLFPAGRARISLKNAALITSHFWEQGGSLAQAILAYLYKGMDRCARGKEFVGSPYLLQLWAESHLPRLIRDISLKKRVSSLREEYRVRLDELDASAVVFHPLASLPISLPRNPWATCILIGAHAFVLYSPHRCIRQVSIDCRDFHGDLPLSHVEAVERRRFGNKDDLRRLKDVLIHWRHLSFTRKIEETSSDDFKRKRQYLQWIAPFIPRDLGAPSPLLPRLNIDENLRANKCSKK